ncbi:unnamed protein product [Rotaria sp. Silwood1]|nr:unnamed protein product [Rotaria sp. Silwood1]CAF1348217.1 unnamed protein product [Rotaria sp. Silwood1]CAF3533088.1 unnamed protein product [Rotaria sp. Silwood1]CAF3567627.1 unnamed protein product [Rotaria sp. Silwood1]CAF4573442.1 unnamed protein product [Rotaria sp. Silwood1]
MYYVNKQIIKTFEHLFNSYCKYNSIHNLISSPRKSRILYRINQEKLMKYYSQYNSKCNNEHFISNENTNFSIEEKKEKPMIPTIKILSKKIINQKTISTQTEFNEKIDSSTKLIDQSVNTLSIISKIKGNYYNEKDTELVNTSSSSSSSITNKTTVIDSSSSSTQLDLNNETNRKTTRMKINSNQILNSEFNDYPSKTQSKNCRIYIRSIVRHMLNDEISDDEQC